MKMNCTEVRAYHGINCTKGHKDLHKINCTRIKKNYAINCTLRTKKSTPASLCARERVKMSDARGNLRRFLERYFLSFLSKKLYLIKKVCLKSLRTYTGLYQATWFHGRLEDSPVKPCNSKNFPLKGAFM